MTILAWIQVIPMQVLLLSERADVSSTVKFCLSAPSNCGYFACENCSERAEQFPCLFWWLRPRERNSRRLVMKSCLCRIYVDNRCCWPYRVQRTSHRLSKKNKPINHLSERSTLQWCWIWNERHSGKQRESELLVTLMAKRGLWIAKQGTGTRALSSLVFHTVSLI